jgi:demethylmenaquinone methyltransferase/2-methoxy-6-polyprenyl-1,4-benzoquinol methylase
MDIFFYLPWGSEASFRKICTDFIAIDTGERILDLCCGNGEMTLPLARSGATEVVGVDISTAQLETARSKAGNLPVTFIEAQADALPFEAAHFSKCVISLGLHHMDAQTRLKALTEARRVLAKGGMLYVIEYHLPRSGLWRVIALLMARLDSSKEALPLIQSGSLPQEIRQAGFEIKERLTAGKGTFQMLRASCL